MWKFLNSPYENFEAYERDSWTRYSELFYSLSFLLILLNISYLFPSLARELESEKNRLKEVGVTGGTSESISFKI